MKKRLLSLTLAFVMVLGMLPVSAMATTSDLYEINTGITEAAQGYVHPTKIRVDADVVSHSRNTENPNEFTVVLAANTNKNAAITLDMDLVGFNQSCYTGFGKFISLNDIQSRGTPADEGENGAYPGTWNGSFTPEWSEDGKADATMIFNGGYHETYVFHFEIENGGSEGGEGEEPPITVEVTEVTLDESEIALEVGDDKELTATVLPINATDKTVTWESSDATVATVDGGVVTAVAAGEATITATAGGQRASCDVTVSAPAVREVQLDKSEAALKLDGTLTLTATVLPENAVDKTVTWSSSDEAVATVADGVVTAVALGKTIITATAGEYSAECKVTVYEPYTGSMDLETGDTDAQGSQRVRVKNINISGVEVCKYQKTGDYSATVLLSADTLKGAEVIFTLDCVGNPEVVNGQIWVNNAQAGTMTAKEGSTTEGTWTYSMVPQWDENGEATISFRSQWRTVSWVAKTYTLNLRILGEENTAPTLKSSVENNTTELIAVGESYELKLTENPLWEDYELDDMSYTVSINGAEAVEASSTWYQFGPETAGEYKLVFRCKDSEGNESADTYIVNITAMDLTRFETGGTAQDNWNADINRIDMGLAEVEEVILSEEEGVYAYAILDSETSKEDKLFFRVKASARGNRFFGVNINDKGVDGAKTDAANFMWSAEYAPEWNEYGEASLKFVAQPQNDNKYVYTIRLKIANQENKAPAVADGGTATDTVEQYFDYTVDVASLFDGVDDSWLSYSVSVDNGETYEACGDSYTITPKTTDTVTLKFKAKDIFGAESEAFVLTLNVSEYEVNEGSFSIDRMTDNGGLLSLTVKDADGDVIEGINFQSSTERKTQSFEEDYGGSFAGMTFEWDETTIKVGLPETVGVSDKVVAHWHMVQNEAGLPFLSTADWYYDAVYNTKDGVATTLNGGVGSSTVRFYDDAEVTYEDCEYGDRYIVEYYIDRGENNKAPQLKEGVPSLAEVTMDQYQTYSVNLNDIFTEPDGDKVTYTVKADGETKEIGNSYSRELTTDEDITIIFKATDPMGASCTYVVDLTVNTVKRVVIETGEGAGTFKSGLNKFYIYGVEEAASVLSKNGWDRYINIQLAEGTPDDAELKVEWEGNNDSVSMSVDNPVKLVDGKAEFTVESNGHFFDRQHRYYHFVISNTPNTLSTLAEGVEATVAEEIMVGSAYELDLSTIFTDADGDVLAYTVSVNGAEAVAAEAAYSFAQSVAGEYVLVFSAKDAWGTSEATYTVNLKVKNSDTTFDVVVAVPDAVTPTFYAFGGYDANEQDTLGDVLTATKGESESGWTSYTVAVPDNLTRISFRGTDGTNDWGGMSIAVSNGMESVKLRQVNAIINTKIDSEGGKVAPTTEQAVFKIKYGADGYAVNGGSFNDSYGNLGYRFLLVAADNSLIYTYYAEPLGDLTGSYATNEGGTKTVTTDVSTPVTAVMALGLKNSFTVTAPVDAEVVMYRQGGYFNYSAIPVASTVNNGDGTKDVVFNNVGNKAIFRVSMDGKVTKAGYSTADWNGGGSIVIDWEDDDRTPDYRAAYDNSTMMGSRGDDSMYVNVNYRNNLQLAVNDTFQLRAYRIWEIIDTDTTNIMIEPDFHYNIISGSDVIDITPTDDIDGIAGQSWLDITAKKAGTAVLEVSYDAIDIISMSKMGGFSNVDEDFTYNASDPARTALVVVQVGGAKNDINFGFDINRTDGWDVEFDTLYFTGDKGQLRLKPTVITDGEIAKVEISGDKGKTYTTLTAGEDGYYTADIVSGNNIIRVTKDDGSEHYQVVRGDKVTLTITEVTGASDQDGVFEAGEKIKVKFNGVHNVIGKMSGIYNPTDYKTNFTFNGETVSGHGGQYTYPQAAYVEITIPGNAADGAVYTLTNGNTTNGGWGSAGGAHRAVIGEVPPGLDADGITNSGRNVFPEVAITVGEKIVSADPVDPSTPVAPEGGEGGESGEGGSGDSGDSGESGSGNSDPNFGLAESEIEGYVTISFEDQGIRLESELSGIEAQYKNPLGTIVEPTQVPFKAYDTIAAVTLRLLDALDMTYANNGDAFSGFYLSKIGNFTVGETTYTSFGEFDAGAGSGWMITWDDWFINKGASEFMVEDGDVVKWQYTCQLGADIGDNASEEAVAAVEKLITAIGDVTLESEAAITAAREAYDELTPAQQSQVDNYATLTAAEAELAKLKATEADKAAADEVEAMITAIGTVALDKEDEITAARTAYDALTDTQKLLVENYAALTDAEGALEALKSFDLDSMYAAMAETLLGQTPSTGSIGGEWLVFGLARATDKDLTDAQKAAYEAAVKAYIDENIKDGQLNKNKPTENERIALALTALGYDPTSYNGKNLLSALENTAWATKQGNNSTAFALLAFNAAGYNASNETDLIQSLLANQLRDGGWNINSGNADADTTAMVVQALAPYYSTNSEVKTAVDKALAYLKGLMNAKGQIDNGTDEPSVETVAQTIVALCELGIDPATWKTANDVNLLHGLASFYVDGAQKGFAHEENGSYDQLSTEQGFYAMVAYKRFLDANATSLYDMSDLKDLHTVEILPCENGSVTVSKSSAMTGETITVTVAPDLGYQISKLTMNDAELTITDNRATFTMPDETAILEATFVKAEASAQAVAQAMTDLEVKDAEEETYDAIADIKKAYSKLAAAEKLEIADEYRAFQNKVKQFETYLKAHIDDAVDELEYFFDDLDEDDYSKQAWKKIEDLYEEALEAVKAARFEEEVYELLEEYLEDLEEAAAGELEVTFRLIGDWKHDDGVSGHDEYVTWIETTEYNMPAGSTIYDLFIKAIDDFDLNEKGASKNYVESIQAPDILGGYWIGEFDNGPNSGWMYTINGYHPGYGLKEQDLEDGDEVIWHYVDDYTLEERKPSSKYYERWLEADDISPETYVKRHLDKIVTVEGKGEVKPELKMSHIGKDVKFSFTPAEGWVIKNVYVDGKDKGAIETYTYKDLAMDARIEVVFAQNVAFQMNFVDVPEAEWFYDDVYFAVSNGLFNGIDEFTFAPGASMTRAMLVTVLYRLEGQPAVTGGSAFADAAAGQWYTDAVIWATRNGIVNGYDNGKFGTDDNVTREQMATILYRYAQNCGYDTTARADLNGYTDAAKISAYAQEAMSWTNAMGLVNGRTATSLAPTGTATRAEVAAIFHRFVENIVK